MSPTFILLIILAYFLVLIFISRLTSRNANNQGFFVGNRESPWYIVAFGMIGASLSGITFISIPGTVANSQFSYMQVVIGYLFGYAVISFVLMPLYYRMNLTSIYSYLGERFGNRSYKIGASYFLLSRIIGAALRLYLVAQVLQEFMLSAWGVPFEITVAISIALIWLYTHKGGIRTIIWTDTLQTLFMLVALGVCVYLITSDLGISFSNLFSSIDEAGYGQWFFTDDPASSKYLWKQILGGAFLAICMTGLDQDMMQKNLSCPNIKDAQKNMISFSVVLFFVNAAFLALGALLFMYIDVHPEVQQIMTDAGRDTDMLFPTVALESGLGMGLGIVFLLGLIAAAYSSADSALTALTTSVCVDFIDTENQKTSDKQRKLVHILVSLTLLVTILIFKYVKSDNVIWELFKAATYTYGPLLGMFSFGIITKRIVQDKWVLIVCLAAPIISYFFNNWLAAHEDWYQFGFELILINGGLTFLGLWLISRPSNCVDSKPEIEI